jgi:putative FmdB family regulatory protein
MPTYDYECTQCGHVFEKFQSITDEPEKICPECGGPVKRRIGTGAGIIFKGGGFYSTDYRSKEYKEKAKSDSTASSPSSSTSETKSPKPSDAAKPSTEPKKPSGS